MPKKARFKKGSMKPDQILRETSTTASLAFQLPVVVVQQLLQILHKNYKQMKTILALIELN